MEKIIKEKISSLLSQEEEVLSVEQLGGMTNQNYWSKQQISNTLLNSLVKGQKS